MTDERAEYLLDLGQRIINTVTLVLGAAFVGAILGRWMAGLL